MLEITTLAMFLWLTVSQLCDAPSHVSRCVRPFQDGKLFHRWIGRGGIIPWHPRSPDLTPDSIVWRFLKEIVNCEEV